MLNIKKQPFKSRSAAEGVFMKKRIVSLIALLLVIVMVCSACDEQLITINDKGNWEIDGTDTGISATGEKGEKGDAVTVTSFELVDSDGLLDTYRITFSDGSKYDFTVTNGKNGEAGKEGKDGVTVVAFEKTASDGLLETWTFKMSDGSNFSFTVANGEQGDKGDDGVSVIGIEQTEVSGDLATFTVYYSNDTTTTFTMAFDSNNDTTITITDISLEEKAESYYKFKLTYSDETSFSFAVGTTSDFADLYAKVATGYKDEAEFADKLLDILSEEFLGSGSILGAKTLGAALSDIFEKLDNYVSLGTTVKTVKTIQLTTDDMTYGFWSGSHRDNTGSQNYYHNNGNKVIQLSAGQGLRILKTNGDAYQIRFVFEGSRGLIGHDVYPGELFSYTTKEDLYNVIFTIGNFSNSATVEIYEESFDLILNPATLTVKGIFSMLYGETAGSSSGGYISEGNSNIIVSTVIGQPSIVAKADSLKSGETISVTETGSNNNYSTAKYTVMNDNTITFSCDITSLENGQYIELGRTRFPTYDEASKKWIDGAYSTAWLKITSTSVQVIHYYQNTNNTIDDTKYVYDHNLTIKDYLRVSIDTNYNNQAEIYIATNGGSFTKTVSWSGRQGDVIARTTGIDIENVQLRWYLEALERDIWLFGDSYFNNSADSRWTYYLNKYGYTNNALWGFPGMNSSTALADFKWAVEEIGYTPHYVVWCMGMNNQDSATAVNSAWLSAVKEFLEICEEYGITPILTTIPSTTTRCNEPKNEWVRAWAEETGGRYIDFAHAVGADKYDASLIGKASNTGSETLNTTGYQWYDGMLYTDDVHPNTKGAEALYSQFIVDFPEIMRKK